MITDRPIRLGVHHFWADPPTEATKETAVRVMVRRSKAGVLYARQFYPPPEGGEIEVLAIEMHGRWEFVPETPLEQQVFRRRR